MVVNYASAKQDADRVVDEISKRGGKAVAIQGNVAKKAEVERLFAEAETAFGKIDIVVNNAGVYEFVKNPDDTDRLQIKALADSGEVTAIDPDALRRYLSFQYVPAPATLVPPARALPPGHVLMARPGGRVDVFRYWRPELRPARSPSSSSPDKILTALRDSVAAHLRSDVPVGAFLSGGVDSATLCALAAESVPDLLTFTVGFDRAEIENRSLRPFGFVSAPQGSTQRSPP